ncbi:MAG: hypothetical protein JXQ87_01220 [Bacteroidia bacterium]
MIRIVLVALFGLLTQLSFGGEMQFSLQPQTDIELLYNEFKIKDVKLSNLSEVDITVTIADTNTYKELNSFILKANSSKTITVNEAGLLKLYNPSDVIVKMSLAFVNRASTGSNTGQKIKIVLANPSHKEYILQLPSGAKPKLGPGSNTGMFFKVGDEILFKHEGEMLHLVTITKEMKNGHEINIHKKAKAQLAN